MIQNDEILKYLILIVIGYFIARIFSKCICRNKIVNGFNVGSIVAPNQDCCSMDNCKTCLKKDGNNISTKYCGLSYDQLNKLRRMVESILKVVIKIIAELLRFQKKKTIDLTILNKINELLNECIILLKELKKYLDEICHKFGHHIIICIFDPGNTLRDEIKKMIQNCEDLQKIINSLIKKDTSKINKIDVILNDLYGAERYLSKNLDDIVYQQKQCNKKWPRDPCGKICPLTPTPTPTPKPKPKPKSKPQCQRQRHS